MISIIILAICVYLIIRIRQHELAQKTSWKTSVKNRVREERNLMRYAEMVSKGEAHWEVFNEYGDVTLVIHKK